MNGRNFTGLVKPEAGPLDAIIVSTGFSSAKSRREVHSHMLTLDYILSVIRQATRMPTDLLMVDMSFSTIALNTRQQQDSFQRIDIVLSSPSECVFLRPTLAAFMVLTKVPESPRVLSPRRLV